MNPIAEKIKKLLRMKRGGTPAEIETALHLAQELAQKHGIDLQSINPDDDQRRAAEFAQTQTACRIRPEDLYASLIIDKFFGVKSLFNSFGDRLIIIGRGWEIEIATYIFKFVRASFVRAWTNRDKRRCRNRGRFMKGCYAGLYYKLMQTHVNPEQAIILSLDAYVKTLYPSLTQVKTRSLSESSASENWGFLAGSEISIRPGVNGSSPRCELANAS